MEARPNVDDLDSGKETESFQLDRSGKISNSRSAPMGSQNTLRKNIELSLCAHDLVSLVLYDICRAKNIVGGLKIALSVLLGSYHIS